MPRQLSKVIVVVKTPRQCALQEIEAFCQIVLQEGQVASAGLKARVMRARSLAFYYDEALLAGVCALKVPAVSYKNRVFREAGLLEHSAQYGLELGWAVTRPEYRGQGICTGLVRALIGVASTSNIYATTRSDSMQKLLVHCGFQRVGKKFGSNVRGSRLQLFLRSGAGGSPTSQFESKKE